MAAPSPRASAGTTLDQFLDQFLQEAHRRFGLNPSALSERVGCVGDQGNAVSRPTACFLECNASQVASHAREITDKYLVDCRFQKIAEQTHLPGEPLLSTYFHYNDIRRMWPRQLSQVHFLTIYPDPALRSELAGTDEIFLYELDEPTAENLASDLSNLVNNTPIRIRLAVLDAGGSIHLPATKPKLSQYALLSPRAWDRLPADERARPRVGELRYVIDPAELDSVAQKLGWMSTTQ